MASLVKPRLIKDVQALLAGMYASIRALKAETDSAYQVARLNDSYDYTEILARQTAIRDAMSRCQISK